VTKKREMKKEKGGRGKKRRANPLPPNKNPDYGPARYNR